MEESKNVKPKEQESAGQDSIAMSKQSILNLCVLGFVAVMTLIGIITFFVAIGREGNFNGSAIASLYVLCMLLAAPTLKVFMDKKCSPLLRRLNLIGIMVIFAAILLMAVTAFIAMAAEDMLAMF